MPNLPAVDGRADSLTNKVCSRMNRGDSVPVLLRLWVCSGSASFPACPVGADGVCCRTPAQEAGQGRLQRSGAYLQAPSAALGYPND